MPNGTQTPPNPDDYAIVVGIDAYPQLRRLQAARSDARRFAAWLIDPEGGGLPSANVRIVESAAIPADPFDARPIQRDIDRHLRDFGVERRKRIGRRLYFYFAGHGFGPTFDDVGMLMADAAMERLESNIGLRHYLVFFHDLELFDQVVFILDCCRDPMRGASTAKPVFTLQPPAGGVPRVERYVVLAAAYGEKAFEPRSQGGERRGVLTSALMEALQGSAANARGEVTATSLREYLKVRVPEIASEANLKQGPEIPYLPDLVLCTVPPARLPRVRVRILVPNGLTGEMILRDGTDLAEIGRRSARDAASDRPPWEVDLVLNSRYQVEHTDSAMVMVLDPRKFKDGNHVYRIPRPE